MKAARERVRKALTITTRKGPSKKHIREMTETEVARLYRIGCHVMPSTNTGMDVLFATRLSDGLEVVIKTRQKSVSFKCAQEEREWRMTTEYQLNMPKVDTLCEFYEVLETREKYYVVMEKVEGRDLFEQMASEGLTILDSREIIRQILEAVRTLHADGRIHKDLKIENVMVDFESPKRKSSIGSIKSSADDSGRKATGGRSLGESVRDMRLSRISRGSSSTSSRGGNSPSTTPNRNITSSAAPFSPAEVKLIDFDTVQDWEPTSPKAKDVLGTDGYIAPEAYAGDYSPASDIYAAGVIMYKLLTGTFPFKSDIFDDQPGENWVGSPAMKRIQDRLKKVGIDFTRPPFHRHVEAAELCCQMLAYSANDRPTAEEALRHEWFFKDLSIKDL
mmetsp:Transcript_86473/g.242033  ORF Transcript_86473/g.242033 Transcript_86473/m.242033 type:complete len:390 (+) Transcript_86473:70-1239(+)